MTGWHYHAMSNTTILIHSILFAVWLVAVGHLGWWIGNKLPLPGDRR